MNRKKGLGIRKCQIAPETCLATQFHYQKNGLSSKCTYAAGRSTSRRLLFMRQSDMNSSCRPSSRALNPRSRSIYWVLTAECSQRKPNIRRHPAVALGKSELPIVLVQKSKHITAAFNFEVSAVFCAIAYDCQLVASRRGVIRRSEDVCR